MNSQLEQKLSQLIVILSSTSFFSLSKSKTFLQLVDGKLKPEQTLCLILSLIQAKKQARKLGRCDSYLRNLKTLPTHCTMG